MLIKRIIYILKKPEVVVLLLLVLSIVVLVFFYPIQKEYTESDVRSLVMEDLKNKYPKSQYDSVDYEILEVNKTSEGWLIKAKVSLNKDSPCPERIHLTYTYPATKFVPEPPRYIVHDCKTCLGQKGCVILFEEEAIVASHTANGTEKVKEFIQEHPNAKPYVSKEGDYWIVLWRDNNESIRVNMSEDGVINSIR